MPTIKSESENPHGLHQRYKITKANGDPVDPKAIYFALRLDSGDDQEYIKACRTAALVWCAEAPPHLKRVASELRALVTKLLKEDK